jgi:hypothetical protein
MIKLKLKKDMKELGKVILPKKSKESPNTKTKKVVKVWEKHLARAI